MKRIVTVMLLLFAIGSVTQVKAQIWKKAVDAAKRTTEKQVEKRTEKAVDKAFEKGEDVVKGKENNQQTGKNERTDTADATVQNGNTKQGQSQQMAWNKFDFVSGDEIIFEDNQAGEQMGEFPSQWDALAGSAEIVSIGGEKAFELQNKGRLVPLMKEKHYLPDMFTIEFDVFFRDSKVRKDNSYGGDWGNGWYHILFFDANDKECFFLSFTPQTRDWHTSRTSVKSKSDYRWRVGSENRNGTTQELLLTTEDWHHLSFSFNQRAMKFYLDETRMLNVPNMNKPAYFQLRAYTDAEKLYFVKNIRIAKGAVPLYDRMMSDGKFITYGITFDVGKSTIKPESMGELNRIMQLMNENPVLKFSVEGHTDSTGNATSNQTLSEARSKAIVDKLVSMGISADRLTASGKGQNSPIADNSTDEGRAKNRRVEFVKI